MRRSLFAWGLILLNLALSAPLYSQQISTTQEELLEALEYLQNQVLEVSIHARIVGEDQSNVWTTKTSKVTISGKTVSITLEGENLKVLAHLIPFLNEDGSLFLVAKGEVWVQEGTDEEKKYYSTVKSLPITAGESVIFFPTGVLMDTEEQNVYTIELEIQVEPLS